jgi:hypothetical protein
MIRVRSSSLAGCAAAAGFALSLLCAAAPAGAQIIYEPVRYQYGDTPTFYYGGSDPAVFEYAERLGCLYHHHERGGGVGDLPTAYVQAGRVGGPRQYVFSDCAPYMNLWLHGFTAADARNEAYWNVPRHFRKADLKRAAVPVGRRAWVVPAQARPVRERELRPRRIEIDGEVDGPAIKPRAIIIIPKGPKKQPKPKDDDTVKTVAAATEG